MSGMSGKHHSEETKIKMRESHLGEKNHNFGKHLSEEQKQKIRNSEYGKKISKETRRKMRASHLGKPHPHRGILFSEETKLKISLSEKGKKVSEESRKKMSKSQTGKHLSEETKQKLSNSFRGEKNPFWKGGVTSLGKQTRASFKYRAWILDVFTRDNFICQECGKRGGYLHAHHLKSFSQIFHDNKIKTLEDAESCGEFWNINNGRTLCKECHRNEHKLHGEQI